MAEPTPPPPAPRHPQVSQTRVVDSQHLPNVLPAERRKRVREQHAELLRRARLDREVTHTARKFAHLGTPQAVAFDLPLSQVVPPPLSLHPSHNLIECGGYAGCIICGGVAGFERRTLLTGLCRGGCPSGSRGPISRLSKGKLPRVSGPHPTLDWPSGELRPTVSRLVA